MSTINTDPRTEILNGYAVDQNSIIRSPGKFEGEPIFAPYLWNLGLDGFADSDDGRAYTFSIPKDDKLRSVFPELNKWLGRKRSVRLVENDQGFVSCH